MLGWAGFEESTVTIFRGKEAVQLRDVFFASEPQPVGFHVPGKIAPFEGVDLQDNESPVVQRVMTMVPFFVAQFEPWDMPSRTRRALESLASSPTPTRHLRRAIRSIPRYADYKASSVRFWLGCARVHLRLDPEMEENIAQDCRMFAECLLGSGAVWLSSYWADQVLEGMSLSR